MPNFEWVNNFGILTPISITPVSFGFVSSIHWRTSAFLILGFLWWFRSFQYIKPLLLASYIRNSMKGISQLPVELSVQSIHNCRQQALRGSHSTAGIFGTGSSCFVPWLFSSFLRERPILIVESIVYQKNPRHDPLSALYVYYVHGCPSIGDLVSRNRT